MVKVLFLVLAAIAVAVWHPPWRWYPLGWAALGWAVPLGLILLFSAVIWIRKRRPDVDEMDEQTEVLQDLREAAACLFSLWP